MDTTASTSTDKASADPVRSEAAAKTVDEDSEKADAEKIEPSQQKTDVPDEGRSAGAGGGRTRQTLKKFPHPDPSSSSSSSSSNTMLLRAGFDRLRPRKRVRSGGSAATKETDDDKETAAAKKQAAASSSSSGFRKEYCRLKTLVPALSEREDLSKVEIIEETIRYIDALHHQLAIRMDGDRGAQPSLCSPPLRDNKTAAPSSANQPSADSGESSTTSTGTTTTSASSTTSSSASMSTPQDLKAAVENIQAMFQAYLQQQQPSTGEEDS